MHDHRSIKGVFRLLPCRFVRLPNLFQFCWMTIIMFFPDILNLVFDPYMVLGLNPLQIRYSHKFGLHVVPRNHRHWELCLIVYVVSEVFLVKRFINLLFSSHQELLLLAESHSLFSVHLTESLSPNS